MSTDRDPKTIRVLFLHDRAEEYIDRMRARFPEVTMEICGSADEVPAALERIAPQVVFSCKCDDIPGPGHRPLLESPSVVWTHVAGAGVEHIVPWDPEEMTVTNSAGILSPCMAETVIGAILMMNFGFPTYFRQQRAHIWQQNLWRPLAGQTLLVVGLGRIGQQVAAKAKAMGMRVLGVRRNPAPLEGIDQVLPPDALHEGLAQADYVGLHTPMTAETRGLIDAAALAAMQPHARLINTARGTVVDEQALIAALRGGTIAGAYLDVFETEPLPSDSPLWDMENVVISPHSSDLVADWYVRFADFFCDNLECWLAGQPLENVVDPARGY